MKKKNVWMEVTKDKYELPVVVADTAKELAEKCGVKPKAIERACWAYRKCKETLEQMRRANFMTNDQLLDFIVQWTEACRKVREGKDVLKRQYVQKAD